jgi:hypothetical protein
LDISEGVLNTKKRVYFRRVSSRGSAATASFDVIFQRRLLEVLRSEDVIMRSAVPLKAREVKPEQRFVASSVPSHLVKPNRGFHVLSDQASLLEEKAEVFKSRPFDFGNVFPLRQQIP